MGPIHINDDLRGTQTRNALIGNPHDIRYEYSKILLLHVIGVPLESPV